MDIKTFKQVAVKLPPHIAILMRGPTGIGKSMVARGIAEELEVPYIDVRGSTMQEGDVIGYPDLEAMKTSGVSTMVLPSWFIRATREPVVLMLDELNRSMPGVQQGFFQIVLDRELGNDAEGVWDHQASGPGRQEGGLPRDPHQRASAGHHAQGRWSPGSGGR